MATKQKILIVDDDTNIAELISLYLTKECYETKMVHDGESALRELQIFQPNLILLDLMGGMLQTRYKRMASHYSSPHLKICVKLKVSHYLLQ